MHTQMHGGDDAITVQDRGTALIAGLEPFCTSPTSDAGIVVPPLITVEDREGFMIEYSIWLVLAELVADHASS